MSTVTTGVGSGRLPWVMLHGGPGGWDYLEPLAELISDHTTVHRFDSRGCGSSDDSADVSIGRLVGDLERLRQHWRHDRWIVLGHSFGATVALAATWAAPRTVAALVYLSGTGIGQWEAAYRQTRRTRWSARQAARRDRLAALTARSAEQDEELMILGALPDFVDPAAAAGWVHSRSARPAPTVPAPAQIAEVDAWPAAVVRERCRGLPVPVLAIRGNQDPRPREAVRRLVDAVPHGRLIDVPGAGHFPWVERPDAVRAALLQVEGDATRRLLPSEECP